MIVGVKPSPVGYVIDTLEKVLIRPPPACKSVYVVPGVNVADMLMLTDNFPDSVAAPFDT